MTKHSRLHILGMLLASFCLLPSAPAKARTSPARTRAAKRIQRDSSARALNSRRRRATRGMRNRRRREIGGQQPICVPDAQGLGEIVYQPNAQVAEFLQQNPTAFLPMIHEVCDDGLDNDCDRAIDNGCTPGTQPKRCGNGVVDPGEACDDANFDNTDGCLSSCRAASCGDGFVQLAVELCDPKHPSKQPCSLDCQSRQAPAASQCGNEIVEDSEECDDGAQGSATCSESCTIIAAAGTDSGEGNADTHGSASSAGTNGIEDSGDNLSATDTQGSDSGETSPGTDSLGNISTGPDDTATSTDGTTGTDASSGDGSGGSGGDYPQPDPDFVRRECGDCIREKCTDIVGFDLSTLPLTTPEDTELFQCMIESRCVNSAVGPNLCYCGDVLNPNICFDPTRTGPNEIPNGPCKQAYETALGTTARDAIAPALTDPELRGGRAGFAALGCIDYKCLDECGDTTPPMISSTTGQASESNGNTETNSSSTGDDPSSGTRTTGSVTGETTESDGTDGTDGTDITSTGEESSGTSTTGGSSVVTVGFPANGIDFVTPECDACFRSKCSDVFGFDFTRLAFQSEEDRELLECMIETRCVDTAQGPNPCYCGDVRNPTICFNPERNDPGEVPNGACKAQYEQALGTTQRDAIAPILTDPDLPGGRAGFTALGCIASSGCLEACGTPPSNPSTSSSSSTSTTSSAASTSTSTTTGSTDTSSSTATSSSTSTSSTDTSSSTTSTIEGTDPDFVTQACGDCFRGNCTDVVGFDLTTLPLGSPEDRELLRCMIQTRCVNDVFGPNLCYCGDVEDPTICFDPTRNGAGEVPNGPCKAEYERALGTTERDGIAPILTDPSLPGGTVGFAALGCIDQFCLEPCGSPPPSNPGTTSGGNGNGNEAPSLTPRAAQGTPINGVDFVTFECDDCFRDKCSDVQGIDLNLLPFQTKKDRRLMECMIEHQCVSLTSGVNPCYCGDVEDPSVCFNPEANEPSQIPNGFCKAQFEEALGTTDRAEIAVSLTNPALPGGHAGFAALGCIREDVCGSACGTLETPVPPTPLGQEPNRIRADLDFVTPICERCAKNGCDEGFGDFDIIALALQTPEDKAMTQCMIRTACYDDATGPLACYCGQVDDQFVCFDPTKTKEEQLPNGPCKAEFEAAWGTTARDEIAMGLYDLERPGGPAYFASLACTGEVCRNECNFKDLLPPLSQTSAQ